jgi:uncharacterized repeat protein (TIGR03803 family)
MSPTSHGRHRRQFYGTTSYGGANNLGVLYKVTPAGKITLLHTFAGPDGEYPASRKPSSISNSIARNEQNRRRLG